MALIHWKQIDGDLANARVLTGSLKVSGSFTLTGSLDVKGNSKVTGSFQVKYKNVEDYFSIDVADGSTAVKVHNDGLISFKEYDEPPSARSGSLFYSGSDEFFLGFKN